MLQVSFGREAKRSKEEWQERWRQDKVEDKLRDICDANFGPLDNHLIQNGLVEAVSVSGKDEDEEGKSISKEAGVYRVYEAM